MSGKAGGPTSIEPISVRIPEAVRLTGMSRSRIYELMRSGDVEFAKVGSSTLIIVESLRRFVDLSRSPARESAPDARR
jgi:hypothetical protein